MFFGVRGVYGRCTSESETTYLTWSNIEQVSSISILWYLLFCIYWSWTWFFHIEYNGSGFHQVYLFIWWSLLHWHQLSTYFISLCWKLMTGWWIWDCINDIGYCKIFISNKYKSIFFSEGDNSISYVIIVLSQNGVVLGSIHFETSRYVPNYEEYFQDLVKVVNNQKFDCLPLIDESYINKKSWWSMWIEKSGVDSSR